MKYLLSEKYTLFITLRELAIFMKNLIPLNKYCGDRASQTKVISYHHALLFHAVIALLDSPAI